VFKHGSVFLTCSRTTRHYIKNKLESKIDHYKPSQGGFSIHPKYYAFDDRKYSFSFREGRINRFLTVRFSTNVLVLYMNYLFGILPGGSMGSV
jgi:hypothetical protein